MSMAASQSRCSNARLMVVMGVSGCGKSTVGAALAKSLGGVFLDGDSFHPAGNIAKMARGEPLTDDDRWPWLDTFARELAGKAGIVVGGCSALKRAYRERIRSAAGEKVLFIHLAGSRELIGVRMHERLGHFMPASLLDSQFATLEAPAADECAITMDAGLPTGEIVAGIVSQIPKEQI